MAPKQFKTLNSFFFFFLETEDLKKEVYLLFIDKRLLNLD